MAEVPVSAVPLVSHDVAEQQSVTRRASLLLAGIVVAGVLSLSTAGICSLQYPVIMSHAFLAFALGLRHAVDVDHLAAIDNVTRQLLRRGQRPVSVGFWFALGHSSVVVVLTCLLAGGYTLMYQRISHGTAATEWLGLVASILSVMLLAGIGCLNAKIALELFHTWWGFRNQRGQDQVAAIEDQSQGALRTAISSLPFLQRTFDRVDRAEKMYFVGALFGLGFDTATQVGLIGLAAISGSQGSIPPMMVLLFPLCFSCGMCLVDTMNGMLMLLTYRWANVEPLQKIFYNFVVTALSACIALIIGSLELLQIIGKQFELEGPFWDAVQSVDMGQLGYMLILTFAFIFGASVLWWKLHKCRAASAIERPLLLETGQSI